MYSYIFISAYQAFRYIYAIPPPQPPRPHAFLTLVILRYVIELKCDMLTFGEKNDYDYDFSGYTIFYTVCIQVYNRIWIWTQSRQMYLL